MFWRILLFLFLIYRGVLRIHSYCIKHIHLYDVPSVQGYEGLNIPIPKDLYTFGLSSADSWDCALVGSLRKDKRGYIECCYTEKLFSDNWTEWARDSMILSGIYTSNVSGAEYYPYRKEDWDYLNPDKLWT
ncbi:unnamed protein product [Echinostoma caproni]|uniref:Uncharacterized protein n=1 Tax=Echinostoma caproni TaxID=27848 RepID=A0A183B6S2_9TREM|nr:unnamed protein product [Echinostoma caproni]